MQSPWQILGLDPSSASEKDAKIAYARLIRVHRPDTDPEGFQRVREAYEVGLAMLRQRLAAPAASCVAEESTTPPNEASPQAGEAPSVSLPAEGPSTVETAMPPELVDAEAAVAKARERGHPGAIGKAIGSLFHICTSLAGGRAGISLWEQTLQRVSDGRSNVIAMGVSIPQMMSEMEAGMSSVTHTCIGWWERAHDMDSIRQLSEGILSEPRRVNEAEASVVALRLAMEIAFVDASLAGRLVNFAFPHLDREGREAVIPQIEKQSECGLVFKTFRKDQQSFWHERVRRPSAKQSWTDPSSDAAIEYLATTRPATWNGYALIRQIAPVEWCTRLDAALERMRGQQPAHTANLDPLQSKQRSDERREWLLWTVRAVCGALLFAVVGLGIKLGLRHWHNARIANVVASAASNPAAEAGSLRATGGQSVTDFVAGKAACEARLAELHQGGRAVEQWVDLALSNYRQVQEAPASRAEERKLDESTRAAMQNFFDLVSRSETDVTVPPRVLEMLVLDSTTPRLIREEAVIRQQRSQLLDSFLKCWELVARNSEDDQQMIAKAAAWYVENRGGRLSLDASERDALVALAKIRKPGS